MTAAYAPRHAGRQPKARGLLASPLLVIGLMVAAAAGFVVHVLWPRWPEPPVGPDAPPLPITVANVTFNVPPGAIRVRLQRQPGVQERLDLVFAWPSLVPPQPATSGTVPTKGARQQPLERLFVTIAAAPDTLPPQERVKSIYPRYTEREAQAGPQGLAVLPFRAGTPYQGEDLIYDSAAPENFLVRCSRAASTPGICLLVRRIGNADITVRFPRDWLADWQFVAGSIETLIASLRPQAG